MPDRQDYWLHNAAGERFHLATSRPPFKHLAIHMPSVLRFDQRTRWLTVHDALCQADTATNLLPVVLVGVVTEYAWPEYLATLPSVLECIAAIETEGELRHFCNNTKVHRGLVQRIDHHVEQRHSTVVLNGSFDFFDVQHIADHATSITITTPGPNNTTTLLGTATVSGFVLAATENQTALWKHIFMTGRMPLQAPLWLVEVQVGTVLGDASSDETDVIARWMESKVAVARQVSIDLACLTSTLGW
jgi:hypothetical protein